MKKILRNSILWFIIASVVSVTAGAVWIDNRQCSPNSTFNKTYRVGKKIYFSDTVYQLYDSSKVPTYTYVSRANFTHPSYWDTNFYILENYWDDLNNDGNSKSLINTNISFTKKFERETDRKMKEYLDSIGESYNKNRNYKYMMPPATSKTHVFTEAVRHTDWFTFVNAPAQRKKDNLLVVFSMAFRDYNSNARNWGPKEIHTQCLNVELSSCWDGVTDTSYWETCDDGNNVSGDGCSATCKIEPKTTSCNSLSAVKQQSDWSAFVTCNATDADSYSINCWNGQTINSSTGKCEYGKWTTSSYNATCTVNGNVTSDSCKTKIDFSNWGGWSNPSCVSTIVTNAWNWEYNVSCTWSKANTYTIDCWNWVVHNLTTWNETCKYSSKWTFDIKCTVNGQYTSDSCNKKIEITNWGWGWWWWGGWWWWTPDGWSPINVVTNPSSPTIQFFPKETVILWYQEKVFENNEEWTPKIKNTSGVQIKIDKKLCVYNMSNGVVNWTVACSDTNIWVLPPWGSFEIPINRLKDFITKSNNNSSNPFDNSKLKVTLEWGKNDSGGALVDVIVAAPTITNVWGWTVYGRYYGVTNLSLLAGKIWDDEAKKNKNFVTTYISTNWWLSSYDVNPLKNSKVVENAKKDRDSDVEKFKWLTHTSTSGLAYPNSVLSSYNWIKDTFYVKGKSLILNASNKPLAGKTYIVDWGDIIITGDINYTGDMSAFVATTGNIRISNSVKNIKWVLMSLKGSIKNNGGTSTKNPLVIKWAMYWDMEWIISKRIRIDYDKTSKLINVWTVVDFNSSVFKNPPPLLWTLVDQYIEIKKVAK